MPKTNGRQGPTILWLLDLIEQYLELNDFDNDGNYFGMLAAGDKRIVQRIRDGGDVSTTKMDDIISFMMSTDNIHRTPRYKGLVTTRTLKPLPTKAHA